MEIVTTEHLIERTPGSDALKRKLIGYSMLGKKEIPESLPFRRALAVAAAADAQDRGVKDPSRVYELLTRSAVDLTGMLVVFFGRVGAPKLVGAASFEPQPATVIDLDELSERLRGDKLP
jgi:hypothetical protein